MTSPHNTFTWYDLATTDAPGATAFYAAVIGWTAQDAGLPDRRYTILSAGAAPMGGLMELPQPALDAGAPPSWGGYIGVADVDGTAARIVSMGGAVHRAAEDIPHTGRFALVSDPQGAAFALFTPLDKAQAEPPQPPPGTPGHVGWRELSAADGPAAFQFYAELFGWTKADAIDMGPMGIYQLFATGGETIGGMMTRPDPAIPPSWLYYFNVDGMDAAVSRVTDAGGRVVHGPQQVPGGSWIAHGIDPQGARFAMAAGSR